LLKRVVQYVTIELHCGDQVLIEASRTLVPKEFAAASISAGLGPWTCDDLPVELRKGSSVRTLCMRLPCGKMRQNQSAAERGTLWAAAAAEVAAKQLGVSPKSIRIDPTSLDEQGRHMAPSGSFPGLVTEYHSAVMKGEIEVREGYGHDRWTELTRGAGGARGATWVTSEHLPGGGVVFHHWYLMDSRLWAGIRARNVCGLSEAMALGNTHGAATCTIIGSRSGGGAVGNKANGPNPMRKDAGGVTGSAADYVGVLMALKDPGGSMAGGQSTLNS
jgi:hypothetical protein